MPEVTNRTAVAAPVERVYEAAKDIEGLVAFISDVERITVTEREERPGGLRTVTAWVGLLPEFKRKVNWIEADEWDDAARVCTFELVSGDFDAYAGSWRFSAAPDGGTVVDLTVSYEYDVPLVGKLVRALVKKKMQDSVDSIQAGLRQRAEEGEEAAGPAA